MLLTCYTQPCGGFFDSTVTLTCCCHHRRDDDSLRLAVGVCPKSEHQVALGLSLLIFNATILTAATVSLLVKPILYPATS